MRASQSPILNWHSASTGSFLLDDWLFNQQSLTRRLRTLCQDQLQVRPLKECWQQLPDDECSVLGCASGSTGWVREVFLCGNNMPWVYARSVCSRDALERSGFDLPGIGGRPLGEFLFSDSRFGRGPLQISQLDAALLATRLPVEGSTSLWARRSCFQRHDLSILVTEIFLPEFWAHAGPAPAHANPVVS